MESRVLRTLLVTTALAFTSAPVAGAQAQTVDRARHAEALSLDGIPGQIANGAGNDADGVLDLIHRFQVALFKGDARAFADLFSDDADFTNVIDESVHGRENIFRHHVGVFERRPPTRTNNLLSYSARFIAPDVVASEIRWDNRHAPEPDGTRRPDRDGVWTSVMQREKDGRWYFKVVRNVMLNDGTQESPGK